MRYLYAFREMNNSNPDTINPAEMNKETLSQDTWFVKNSWNLNWLIWLTLDIQMNTAYF